MSYSGPKASFNVAAEQYDSARPSYPAALVDLVVHKAGLDRDSEILEIGAGTGKASVLFAARGYKMVCLEPGEVMGDIARRNLAPYARAEVLTTTLEDWPLQRDAFDLAISAQAFHWVDPEVGFPKVAQALKPEGWLAFFWNLPNDPESELWTEIQGAYEKLTPEMTRRWSKKTLTQEVEEIEADLAAHAELFRNQEINQFAWSRMYSADEYIQLLGTYSDHIGLDEEPRQLLFDSIHEIITRRGGSVEKCYTCVLQMAQRR